MGSLSDSRLVRVIAMLLATLGVLLLAEAVLPIKSGDLLPRGDAIHFGAGFTVGLGVGIVSSVLGVAGGELLIPALVLVFGADIKTAGSASILISLGIVAMVFGGIGERMRSRCGAARDVSRWQWRPVR